jgi:hypothetical protein
MMGRMTLLEAAETITATGALPVGWLSGWLGGGMMPWGKRWRFCLRTLGFALIPRHGQCFFIFVSPPPFFSVQLYPFVGCFGDAWFLSDGFSSSGICIYIFGDWLVLFALACLVFCRVEDWGPVLIRL